MTHTTFFHVNFDSPPLKLGSHLIITKHPPSLLPPFFAASFLSPTNQPSKPQLMINWCFGLVVWDSRVPLKIPIPFIFGDPNRTAKPPTKTTKKKHEFFQAHHHFRTTNHRQGAPKGENNFFNSSSEMLAKESVKPPTYKPQVPWRRLLSNKPVLVSPQNTQEFRVLEVVLVSHAGCFFCKGPGFMCVCVFFILKGEF